MLARRDPTLNTNGCVCGDTLLLIILCTRPPDTPWAHASSAHHPPPRPLTPAPAVCGSFKKADHCGALVDQLAADELAAGKLVALARDGSLCAVEDYRFILTTMVANKQPWAFTDNVCAPYYFTADVLCN